MSKFDWHYLSLPRQHLAPYAETDTEFLAKWLDTYERKASSMSTINLTIEFTDLEPGRVRAQITTIGGGIFAEAADAQTAAGNVVKQWYALYASTPAFPEQRTVFARSDIKRLIEDAIANNDLVTLQYVKVGGERSTRTVEPFGIVREGSFNEAVYGWDEDAAGERSFLLSGIRSAALNA